MTEAIDFSLFVGDLAADVDDSYLESFFRQHFPSVKTAKVICDPVTSRSKGYGFVRFSMEQERDRALNEMSGTYISTRPVRCSVATAKKAGASSGGGSSASASSAAAMQGHALGSSSGGGSHPAGAAAPAAQPPPGAHPADLDPNNTTLFIGGLSAVVLEDQLRNMFARYGDIIYTKVPQGKGCGFVQFVERRAAEAAMNSMNGQIIGNSAIRISWGRSSSKAGLASSAAQHTASAAHAAMMGPPPYGYSPHGYPPMGYGYHPDHNPMGPGGMGPPGPMGYAPYGMYHDPYGGAYHHPAYPYQAYAYSMMPPSMYGMPPGMPGMDPQLHHSPASSGGGGPLGPGMPQVSGPYDPKGVPSVDQLNAMYMQRQMPPMMHGGYMRMMPAPPQ